MGLFDGTALERPVLCDRCGVDVKLCRCPPLPEPDVAPNQQTLRIKIEKRKKGKLVTHVTGFLCQRTQIEALLQKLKNSCGAGGSCDESSLEIQGDHLSRVKELLKSFDYQLRT